MSVATDFFIYNKLKEKRRQREIVKRRRKMVEEKEILRNEEITKMSDFVPTTYKLFLDKLARLRPSEFNAQKDQDNNENKCSERISFRPPTRGLTADQITVKWLRPQNNHLPEIKIKEECQREQKMNKKLPTKLPSAPKSVLKSETDDYDSNKRKDIPSSGTKKVECAEKTIQETRFERFDSGFDCDDDCIYGEKVPRWISSVTIRKRVKTN